MLHYYHERYPNNLSAIQMYVAKPCSDLPEGAYAFLELYCCNPECECKLVKIEIVKQSSRDLDYFETAEQPMAVLDYEWEAPLSEQNPKLSDDASQSEWAKAARQVFVDYAQVDPYYNIEIASRSLLMKTTSGSELSCVGDRYKPFKRETPKMGRNDPCLCGSGKKYKKCCMEK
jgi:SEC-C motif-containing protein